MCKICVEWQNGKLTTIEAARNLGEMWDGSQHQIELVKRILDENGELDVVFNEYEEINIRKNGQNYEAALNGSETHYSADEADVEYWIGMGHPRLGCFPQITEKGG